MNTQTLVTTVKEEYLPGYSRAKILSFLKRAQNEVYNEDCAQTLFLNTSDDTLPLPYLSTTTGTLTYVPSASNLVDSDGNAITLQTRGGYAVSIRRIRRVFFQASDLDSTYDNKYYGRDIMWSGVDDNWATLLASLGYQERPGMPFDKTAADSAHFVFAEDPGTHSDRYLIEMYMGPIDLTSEDIPMSLDTDRFAEGIIKACRGYAEESRTGTVSTLLDGDARTGCWRRYWMPRIRNALNSGGSQLRTYGFPMREAG